MNEGSRLQEQDTFTILKSIVKCGGVTHQVALPHCNSYKAVCIYSFIDLKIL
jgi:hypothetical protein